MVALRVAVLCLLLPSAAFSSGDENLPLDHWAYGALERFERLGHVWLPAARPYSRREVRDLVARIRESAGEVDRLAPRDRYQLRRLEEEFGGAEPRERYDRPLLYIEEEDSWAALDLLAGPRLERTPNGSDLDPFLVLRPSLLLRWGRYLTFESRYDAELGPEEDGRADEEKPSPRVRSWRGLTSEYRRGYLRLSGDRVSLLVGREEVDWGPSLDQNLLLSRGAGPLDQAALDLGLGAFRLHLLHARLEAGHERWLAAHRLEIRGGSHWSVGVAETIVYEDRLLDPAYLLPFAWFYANQWNEREDDNVLWSVDARARLPGAGIVYGELLVDDFQYEGDEAPNKTGYTLGLRGLAPGWSDRVEVNLEYTRIDAYTYSHKDTLETRYLTGDGRFGVGNHLLGHAIGPDSDRWRVGLTVYPSARLRVDLASSWGRHGERDDLTPWEDGLPPDPPFPSGVIERVRRFEARIALDLARGGRAAVVGGVLDRRNREHRAGEHSSEGFLRVEILWDF